MDSHLQRILDDPKAQDLMWVLRVIECQQLDKPRVGNARSLKGDVLRANQPPELRFASSSIADLKPDRHGLKLDVNAFGMWGPNGVMPLTWTEAVYDRLHHAKDATLLSFTGVFQHRMICLFYKAWALTRKAVDFDRPAEQKFLGFASSLAGVSLRKSPRAQKALPDFSQAYYGGLLGRPSRDPVSLGRILSDFFGIPFKVREFHPRWIPIPDAERSVMGGMNASLGQSAVVGEHYWDAATKFRLVAGPVDQEDLNRLTLDQGARAFLTRWMKQWVGYELEWELLITAKAEDAPCTRLGHSSLGRNTWTFARQPGGTLNDVILTQSVLEKN